MTIFGFQYVEHLSSTGCFFSIHKAGSGLTGQGVRQG